MHLHSFDFADNSPEVEKKGIYVVSWNVQIIAIYSYMDPPRISLEVIVLKNRKRFSILAKVRGVL